MMLLERGFYNFYCRIFERNGKFKYYIREMIILKDEYIFIHWVEDNECTRDK